MNNSERAWVIWSEEHQAWWAPAKQGYTSSLKNAGRYTQAQAQEIEQSANAYLPPEAWRECAFPDPLLFHVPQISVVTKNK